MSPAAVRAIHADQIREHGGSLGLRDAGLLESALDVHATAGTTSQLQI